MTTLITIDWEKKCQDRIVAQGVEQIRDFYYCISCGHPIDIILVWDSNPPEKRARAACLCNTPLPCQTHKPPEVTLDVK